VNTLDTKFDNYVASIQSQESIWSAYYLEQEKNYGHLLPANFEASIIEFGPGRGYFVDWLLCKGYVNITLVEMDKENCRFLTKKYTNFPGVKVFADNMVSYLQSTNQIFDLIISKQVLEHIPINDIASVFKNGKKRLTENGVMVHETINASNVIYGTHYRYIDFTHTISFTEKSIREFSCTSVNVRNYERSSVLSFLLSKFKKKINLDIKRLEEYLILSKESQQDTVSKKGLICKLLRSCNIFFQHCLVNFKIYISKILTVFFHGRQSVTTPFMIVEVRKHK
jgi:2-polyprenyl-3-methyl-5-hydroxy-6-metoxy-1,4-benzoquinol methylase